MRRVALWISIISFIVIAVCNATSFFLARYVISITDGEMIGQTFYTPYMTRGSPPFTWQLRDACNLLSSIAFPLGLISVSIYMLLTESLLRRTQDRGFEVS